MKLCYANTKLAPIALFVYNRPGHTRRTVESLTKNILARQSDLFVFSDGPKNYAATAAVQEVRRFVHTIEGFQSVTAIERETNFGLANSVIAGVTQLCNDFGRAIAVEDDILTSSDFLIFMNRAFERYESESRVWSISGFNFGVDVPARYPYDAFYSYRSSSWGWGTWEDRWSKTDWAVCDYFEFRNDATRRGLFNRGGADLYHMLDLQMAGKIDSWSIRWDYAHFKQNAVTLLPVVSKVYNIGMDGSGVHCRRESLRQAPLTVPVQQEYRFPETVETDPWFDTEIRKLHRISLVRKLARKLRQQIMRSQ